MAYRSPRAARPVSSCGQTPEAVLIFMLDFPLRSAGHLLLGHEHEIQGRRAGGPLVAAEALPQQPLRAVAHHRSTQPAAGGQAEAVVAAVIRQSKQEEQRAIETQAVAEHAAELQRRPQA
jgi:hypothetical protein